MTRKPPRGEEKTMRRRIKRRARRCARRREGSAARTILPASPVAAGLLGLLKPGPPPSTSTESSERSEPFDPISLGFVEDPNPQSITWFYNGPTPKK